MRPFDPQQARWPDARAEAEARAEQDPAAAHSCILALACALGHNQEADDAGNMQLDDNIVRKLGSWRKALRGAGPEDLAWCRALVLLQLHERSFASLKELKEKDTKLKVDGWECRALHIDAWKYFEKTNHALRAVKYILIC